MSTTCNPDDVTNFLLIESRERGEILTNLKLQKLLYYAQAWALVAFNRTPLFHEDFQAWVHGPVLVSQYIRFKDREWRPIIDDTLVKPNLDAEIEEHLVEIIDVFGVETAVSLELMTHREDPWLKARDGLHMTDPSQKVITKDSMWFYYSSL